MHVIRIISIFILFSFINFNTYSSEIFSKGSGTVQVKNVKKIKPEESELAKKKAVESAWKKYTGKFDVSKMKQYMLIEEDINLDDYINDVQVLDNVVDTGTKTLKTIVKISINEVRLTGKLQNLSAAGSTGTSQGSTIVAYYISRETGSLKSFQKKKTNIQVNEGAKSVTDSMEGDTDSVNSKEMSKTQTGGSTEKKADRVSYTIAKNVSPTTISNSLNAIFTPAGFQFSDFDTALNLADPDATLFDIEMATIADEFVEKNGSLGRKTKGQINKVMRELAAQAIMVNYLVQIVTDINLPYEDSVTGNQKVDVSMGLSITDVSKPLAGVVASDTVVASGSGQDSITASNNAIKEASTEVAKLVVNMLNSKGIN